MEYLKLRNKGSSFRFKGFRPWRLSENPCAKFPKHLYVTKTHCNPRSSIVIFFKFSLKEMKIRLVLCSQIIFDEIEEIEKIPKQRIMEWTDAILTTIKYKSFHWQENAFAMN